MSCRSTSRVSLGGHHSGVTGPCHCKPNKKKWPQRQTTDGKGEQGGGTVAYPTEVKESQARGLEGVIPRLARDTQSPQNHEKMSHKDASREREKGKETTRSWHLMLPKRQALSRFGQGRPQALHSLSEFFCQDGGVERIRSRAVLRSELLHPVGPLSGDIVVWPQSICWAGGGINIPHPAHSPVRSCPCSCVHLCAHSD